MRRLRAFGVPELFLGLLAIAVAVVWTAYITTNTIRGLRHTRDTDAISTAVVYRETLVTKIDKHRSRTRYRVSQRLDVSTTQIDLVERIAPHVGELIERDIDVSAEPLEYLSTELTQQKLAALQAATQEVRRRADILVRGLGGRLGRMRSSTLGVYQVTPRDSTDVSDYGINDTSSREKDVTAVVTATFNVDR